MNATRLPWWLIAVRPLTLSLAIAPVLVGTALAHTEGSLLDAVVFSVTVLCAVAIQVGTNLFNDVEDALGGNDGAARAGPTRVTAAGLATPRQVRLAAWLSFSCALLAGLFLVRHGGWPVLVLGLASLAAGWAYSNGPKPLSHTPWGEVFVIVFFGIVAVLGSHYLQSGRFSATAWWVGLMLGTPAAAVLLVNNVRDLDADLAVGRRTLAAVLGKNGSRRLYLALMLVPLCLSPLLGITSITLALLLVSPLSVWLGWRFMQASDPARLNSQLHYTAQSQLALGGLMCLLLIW